MRFGKKLALQVTDDHSGAPYLSHKAMKEAINKTVRELRTYQSRVQSNEQVWRGAALHAEAAASPEELRGLEGRISELDRMLFDLVDEDIVRILEHVRSSEAHLTHRIGLMQSSAIQVGMLIEESQAQKLEKALPFKPENRMVLCQQILELKMRTAPLEVKAQLEELATQYNATVDAMNRHSQYLEINVAGFRKLLKRHEKQIPQHFHARPMPFFGFHRLVTHSSLQLMEIVRQFGAAVDDAWARLATIASAQGSQCVQSALTEIKSLGAECQMVLEIQKQLKDARHNPALVDEVQGMLYSRPGLLNTAAQAPAYAYRQPPPQQPQNAPWPGTAVGQQPQIGERRCSGTAPAVGEVNTAQGDGAGMQQEDLWQFLQTYSGAATNVDQAPSAWLAMKQ